jgi:Zn-finger nucleic acid-binding protein
MKCPHCKTNTLESEVYEKVEIDRCTKCDGVWLDEGELGKIVTTKEMTFSSEQVRAALAHTFAGLPEDKQDESQLCPICSSTMKAVNYMSNSGIIIHRCPTNEGVWLDAKALDKAQIFSETGETNAETHKAMWTELIASVARQEKNAIVARQEKNSMQAKKAKTEVPSQFVLASLLEKLRPYR